jgi:tetratricopeptide (TPR) repeat protein
MMLLQKSHSLRIALLFIIFFAFLRAPAFSQSLQDKAALLFKNGQKDQKGLKWQDSLSKFREVITVLPHSAHAQRAHIEIGKFYKYNRDWQKAVDEYHQAIDIDLNSRDAHDAKTAEAAVYYFRQDFPRALEIFQEVLNQTQDWDQIKYTSYWIKEVKQFNLSQLHPK